MLTMNASRIGSVFHVVCSRMLAAGGLERDWRNEEFLNCTCTRGGLSIADCVCSVVSNYIQVIVFYLLAQTKVIYLHIYKPINKVS